MQFSHHRLNGTTEETNVFYITYTDSSQYLPDESGRYCFLTCFVQNYAKRIDTDDESTNKS